MREKSFCKLPQNTTLPNGVGVSSLPKGYISLNVVVSKINFSATHTDSSELPALPGHTANFSILLQDA